MPENKIPISLPIEGNTYKNAEINPASENSRIAPAISTKVSQLLPKENTETPAPDLIGRHQITSQSLQDYALLERICSSLEIDFQTILKHPNTSLGNRNTILHLIIESEFSAKEKIQSIQQLITLGAKTSILNSDHSTCLHLLLEKEELKPFIPELLKIPTVTSSLHITNVSGETFLDLAVLSNDIQITKALLATKSISCSSLIIAANIAIQQKNHVILQLLLSHISDINHRLPDTSFTSPLCTAIQSQNIDLVKLCLEYGSDPNQKDYYEKNALMIALEHPEGPLLEIIDLLIDYGANLRTSSESSYILREYAFSNRNLKVIERLLKAQIDVNPTFGTTQCVEEISLLEKAMAIGDHELVNLLLAHGAQLKTTSKETCFTHHTKISLDCSQFQDKSLESRSEIIKILLFRELMNIGYETTDYDWALTLRGTIFEIHVLSEEALSCIKQEEDALHTLIKYSYEAEPFDKNQFLEDKKNTPDLLKRHGLSLAEGELISLRSLKSISRCHTLLNESKPDTPETLDDHIHQLLKHPFFNQPLSNPFLKSLLLLYRNDQIKSFPAEAWNDEAIYSLIRDGNVLEHQLLSLLSLKVYECRKEGAVTYTEINDHPQPDVLHIGLDKCYQDYLDCCTEIIENLDNWSTEAYFERYYESSDQSKKSNPFKETISINSEALEQIKSDIRSCYQLILSEYTAFQSQEPKEAITSIEQNAWIIRLMHFKALLQKYEMAFSSEAHLKTLYPDLPFDPVYNQSYIYFKLYRRNLSPLHRLIIPEKDNFILGNFKDLFTELCIDQFKDNQHAEKYLLPAQSSVPNSSYKAIATAMKKIPSTLGTGIHLNSMQPLSEKELTLMQYMPIIPVGHLKPLLAFHDGSWREPFFFRLHDLYHQSRFLKIYEKIHSLEDNVRKAGYELLDKCMTLLEVKHRMFRYIDDPKSPLEEGFRKYIRLILFSEHEQAYNLLDNIFDGYIFEDNEEATLCYMTQDLLHELDISYELSDSVLQIVPNTEVQEASDGLKVSHKDIKIKGKHDFSKLKKEHAKIQEVKKVAALKWLNEKLEVLMSRASV